MFPFSEFIVLCLRITEANFNVSFNPFYIFNSYDLWRLLEKHQVVFVVIVIFFNAGGKS